MQYSRLRLPIALPAAIAVLMLTLAAPPPARADDDANGADANVAVARISYLQGPSEVQRGDTATPVAAALNAPLLGADYVTTGAESRAEIQFDGALALRMGPDAQIRFTHLDPDNRELQLAQGAIELRLMRGAGVATAIDTPSVSIRPLSGGAYRVSVDAGGNTQITVRSGRAEVALPQGAQALAAGQTMLAQGTPDAPVVQVVAAIARDGFDSFNAERDRSEAVAFEGTPYVSPSVQGVGDLYANGRWVDDSSYGQVWIPTTVAAGWAPYRDGRWVWEDGFGWTWVSYEPWGWAPYHYGRWYHSAAYGWAWAPPRPAVVEVWRPALVAFIGFGGGGGVSVGVGGGFGFGFGNIGWVPLAPYEPYHPWYGRGYTSVVNTTNVTNNYYGNVNNGEITRMYRNANYGGVTSVSQQRFTEGRFDHPVTVLPSQLRNVQLAHGPLPVVPTQANLRYSDREPLANGESHPQLIHRTFAGNATPTGRTPFEQQRTVIQNVTHAAPAATSGQTGAGRDPWSRFGTTNGTHEPASGNRESVNGNVTGHGPASVQGTAANGTVPTAPRRAIPTYAQPSQTTPNSGVRTNNGYNNGYNNGAYNGNRNVNGTTTNAGGQTVRRYPETRTNPGTVYRQPTTTNVQQRAPHTVHTGAAPSSTAAPRERSEHHKPQN